LRILYKTPELLPDIKRRCFEWLRHVVRMDQARVARKFAPISQRVSFVKRSWFLEEERTKE
jgi:hypothetical protein